MGTNPNATNADLVCICYDASGAIVCIVHADNDDFQPHGSPGLTPVTLPYPIYAALPPPRNTLDYISHYDLAKVAIADLQVKDSEVAAKLQARIDAFEQKLASDAVVEATQKAIGDAFVNSITPQQLADFQAMELLDDAQIPAALDAFSKTLMPDQKLKFDAVLGKSAADPVLGK